MEITKALVLITKDKYARCSGWKLNENGTTN